MAVYTWSPEPGAVRAPAGSQGRRRSGHPAYAALAGVADPARRPPAYIEVAQLDMFRDEDLVHALRRRARRVPPSPRRPHEFDFIAFTTAARRHRRPRSFEHQMPVSLTGWPPCSQP